MGWLCCLAACVLGIWKGFPVLGRFLPRAAMVSAGIQLMDNPLSGTGLLQNGAEEGPPNTETSVLPDPVEPDPVPNVQEEEVSDTAGSGLLTEEEAKAMGMLPVKEVQLATIGNTKSTDERVSMNNKSKSLIRIEEELAKIPDVRISDTQEPQVLIYHTHTTECYMAEYNGYYPKDMDTRSMDGDKGVLRVGEILTEKLTAAGIGTIHDTTVNDSPAYSGAYGRSLAKAEAYLKQHPSIRVILDVHRDSVTQNDGTKLKPTVTINGKKAAQVMIVSGCDDNGTLGYPEWRKNLVFALQIQKRLADIAPKLARPVYCWNIRYNQHLTPGTLLVEFGTEVNTYEEVAYAAELFAQALIQTLQDYKV